MTQVDPRLTAGQVAQRFNDAGIPCTDETVRQWANKGRLAFVELPSGRRWFRQSDVDAIINGDVSASTGSAA